MTENFDGDELYTAEEDSFDLQALIGYLISHVWIIAIAAILMAMAGLFYSAYMQTPMYRASTTVYVLDRNSDTVTTGALAAGLQLTGDYAQIIKSHTVCGMVIEDLSLNMTPSQLASMVSVSAAEDETRVLRISVSSPDPVFAQKAANSIRVVASDYLMSVMELPNINLIDEAELPVRPYSPNVKKTVVMFAAIGILIAGGLLVLKFLLDDTIKTEEDVKKRLGLSVLGMVPNEDKDGEGKKNKGLSKYILRLSHSLERRQRRHR